MLQKLTFKSVATYHLTYFFLAFIAMSGLSYINFLPGVVNALAGNIGFSDAEAGQIVALNGYGGLLGSTAAIFLVHRIRWQPTLLICLSLLLAMDLATIWINDMSWMLGWRFLAGTFGGLALGMTVAQLARLENPDRAFGTLLFVQFSIGSLVMITLPNLERMMSTHAVFLVMASFSLISLLFVFPLQAHKLNSTTAKPSAQSISMLHHNNYRHALLLLCAVVGYQLAASAIWAYVGLIGLSASMTNENVNNYIAITGLLGLLGAVLPILLGNRYGRLIWLMTGIALSTIAAVLLNFSQHHQFYVLAMALLFLAWPAVQSYLLAITAELDPSGKLSTIAAVVSSVGLASGPLMASTLLNDDNFSALLNTCAALFVLSYVLLLKPAQAKQKTTANTVPSA